MKSIGVLAVFIGFGAIATVACGSDNNGGPAAGGGTAGNTSAGHSGSGGSGGSAGSTDDKGGSTGVAGKTSLGGSGGSGGLGGASGGAGGDGGAPMEVPAFVSSPVAELSLDAATQAAGFTLVSSNLTEKPSGDSYYKEWFGEVHNGSKATQCFVQVDADFQDGTGGSLLKLHTFAYGPAYDLGDGPGLPGACASPGDTLPLWSNALDGTNVKLDSIKKIVVHVEALERPNAKLHPSTPTLGAVNKVKDPGLEWWTYNGTATAVADIYNVQLEFWGKSGGLIVGKTDAFHSDNFLKGEVWSFDTLAGIDTPTIDSTAQYFDFIDGKEGALRVQYSGDAAIAAAQHTAAKEDHQATQERSDQAR